ncbi:MAG: PDZ domain-containing protein [Bacteroidota bacterium]
MTRFLLLGALLLPSWLMGAIEGYEYTLEWLAPHTKTYKVTIKLTPEKEAVQTTFHLPAWRPGRYYLQNYSGAVSEFEAKDRKGKDLNWQRTATSSWTVSHPAGIREISVTYHYYANNQDAGSSYLAANEVYFNPVNLFMYAEDRLDDPVVLRIPELDTSWGAATALGKTDDPRLFETDDYHDFVDCPTVFSSKMKTMDFEVDGTTFYLHFQGNYLGDLYTDDAIVDAVTKIVKEQGAVFGGFPFTEYHFIYRLLPFDMRHAVEHKNSASFALPERVTQSENTIIGGVGSITAHEFWHAWNVKRIRPAALWPYDYSQPVYTSLHWFTEGVTDYYDQLSLIRVGVTKEKQFYSYLARIIQSLENNYASSIVSSSEASFNSWLATSPYAHPYHRISYYTLGSRAGLMLDLALRVESEDKVTLDDIFRYLFENYYQKDQGVPEDGVQEAAEKLTGKSWEKYFQAHIHGTEPYDYEKWLSPFGLELKKELPESLGLRVLGIISSEPISQGILVRRIHPSGDAYAAGIFENTLIVEIDGQSTLNIDVEEYMGTKEKGDTLTLRIYQEGEIKEVIVEHKARFIPYNYEMTKMEKAKPQQEARRETWLKSIQK